MRSHCRRSGGASPSAGSAHASCATARRPRGSAPALSGESYWARPLPGFGDPHARILLIGLAPAAHGGNRTGRMLPATGAATGSSARSTTRASPSPSSVGAGDGLVLRDVYITATLRCAPPANKPTPVEMTRCQPFLLEELRLLAVRGPSRSARSAGTPICAPDGRWGRRPAPATPLRPRGDRRVPTASRSSAAPPKPAEHVHGQADPPDAPVRVRRARRIAARPWINGQEAGVTRQCGDGAGDTAGAVLVLGPQTPSYPRDYDTAAQEWVTLLPG